MLVFLRMLPFFLSSKYTEPSNLDHRERRGKGIKEIPLPETTKAFPGVRIGQGQHAATDEKKYFC